MKKKEFEKEVRQRAKFIRERLVGVAMADCKLDYDTRCLKALDQLNEFMEFIGQNNPKIKT